MIAATPTTYKHIARRPWAAAVVALVCCPLFASAPAGTAGGVPGDASTWTSATYSCASHCVRDFLPERHQVAAVLAGMATGDATLMFLDPRQRIDSLPLDDLLALHVTFAARDAELGRIAGIFKTCCARRMRFVPRAPKEHVNLLLDRVAVAELLHVLAAYGEVRLPGWSDRLTPAPPGPGSE
jgi:hypothetical protein